MTDEQNATAMERDDAPSAEPKRIEPRNRTTVTDEQSPEMQRFWQAVKRLPAYLRLSTAILRDPAVPQEAKVRLGLGGAYAVSPIDLVPGVIPVAGQMDDLYVVLTGLKSALGRMDPADAERHLDAAGITVDAIDEDLKAIRDLAKLAVVKSAKFGGKVLGRLGRATVRFADNQFRRKPASRPE